MQKKNCAEVKILERNSPESMQIYEEILKRDIYLIKHLACISLINLATCKYNFHIE